MSGATLVFWGAVDDGYRLRFQVYTDSAFSTALVTAGGKYYDLITDNKFPRQTALNRLAQGGATDGQVLSWDETSGTWAPEAASAGAVDGNVSAYAFLYQANLSEPTRITSNTVIPTTGTGYEWELLSATEVSGPVYAGIPFITEWEGSLELELTGNAKVTLRLKTTHAVGDKSFTHTRDEVVDMPGGQRQSIAMNRFNSISTVRAGDYTIDGSTVTLTEDDLSSAATISYTLELISFTRGSTNRAANNISYACFHNLDTISFQLRQARSDGTHPLSLVAVGDALTLTSNTQADVTTGATEGPDMDSLGDLFVLEFHYDRTPADYEHYFLSMFRKDAVGADSANPEYIQWQGAGEADIAIYANDGKLTFGPYATSFATGAVVRVYNFQGMVSGVTASGNQVLAGTRIPTGDDGVDGDFWVAGLEQRFYSCRSRRMS